MERKWSKRVKRRINRKRYGRKYGLFGKFDIFAKISRSSYYPLIKIGMLLAGLAAVAALAVFVIAPLWQMGFDPEGYAARNTPSPTPADQVARDAPVEDKSNLVHEILFQLRYVNEPYFSGDDVVCTSGQDGAGNPQPTSLYVYNIKERRSPKDNQISAIKAENDDLLEARMSANWIIWVDSKRNGGGSICAYNRSSGAIHKIKDYKGAVPKLRLSGDMMAWAEQTATAQDKIYLHDLSTGSSATLAVLDNVPFGMGGADICATEVIWAGPNPDAAPEEAQKGSTGAIYSANLSSGEVSVYQPGMYVHSPVTNGNVRAWTDTNSRAGSTLYISVADGPPRKIESGVIGYDLGRDFIAYCKDGVIWLYYWEAGRYAQLSKENLSSIFISVNDNRVIWYDVTYEQRSRDIIKYAVVE
ncbi:MAG: hypothetical protein ACOYJD_08860 [Christensenellales bacterium]|jgi:hypothetical protein